MDIKSIKEYVQSQLLPEELALGEIIYNNCDCQILSQSPLSIEFLINQSEKDTSIEYVLLIDDYGEIIPESGGNRTGWDRYAYACLMQYEEELNLLDNKENIDHKQYTREGMIKRVLAERRIKAEKALYRIEWANNIYGDHTVINEQGVRYKVLLRDWENETLLMEENETLLMEENETLSPDQQGNSPEMPDISRLEEIEDQKADLQDNNDHESENTPSIKNTSISKAEEIEQVMNSGMQFLAGLFKMSTGNDLGIENQSIKVDKETGEVVMKFKLPL